MNRHDIDRLEALLCFILAAQVAILGSDLAGLEDWLADIASLLWLLTGLVCLSKRPAATWARRTGRPLPGEADQ